MQRSHEEAEAALQAIKEQRAQLARSCGAMTSDELVKVLARPPNFTQDLIKARETGLQQRALAHALTLEKREEGPSTKLAGLGKDAAAAKRQ